MYACACKCVRAECASLVSGAGKKRLTELSDAGMIRRVANEPALQLVSILSVSERFHQDSRPTGHCPWPSFNQPVNFQSTADDPWAPMVDTLADRTRTNIRILRGVSASLGHRRSIQWPSAVNTYIFLLVTLLKWLQLYELARSIPLKISENRQRNEMLNSI